jgi:hypothetical protein
MKPTIKITGGAEQREIIYLKLERLHANARVVFQNAVGFSCNGTRYFNWPSVFSAFQTQCFPIYDEIGITFPRTSK